jgi:hypothetical protein
MSGGQLDLFGLPEPDERSIGGFHAPESEAPDTERLGAIDVYPRSGTQRRRVLDAIAAAGDDGRTDDELRLELNIWRAEARREELKRAGWVEDSGRRRRTSVNGTAAAWRLTELGLAAYPRLEDAAA